MLPAGWRRRNGGAPTGNIVSTGTVIAGPTPPTNAPPYALNGSNGEWDDFATSVTIPAGATYACFQIESIDGRQPHNGASGVWLELVTKLPAEPTAVSLARFGAEAVPGGLMGALGIVLLGAASAAVVVRRKDKR